jgi:hypothetical protein
MIRAVQRGEWVQLEMNMNLPQLERVHRRQVKKRGELLWDELQRKKKNTLGVSGKS